MSLLKGYASDEYKIEDYDLQVISIKGTMVTCKHTMSDISLYNMSPADLESNIKQNLATKLARHLLESNNSFIEFAKRIDPVSGETHFMARLSVVPKDSTQIFKKHLSK